MSNDETGSRLRHYGHSFNKKIGFTIDENADNDYNKLKPKRNFVLVFSLIGIILGIAAIIAGIYAPKSPLVKDLKADTDDSHNLDVEDFDKYGTQLAILGGIILSFSLFGFISCYFGQKIPMIVYSLYLIVSTLIMTGLVTFCAVNFDTIRNNTRAEARRMWYIGKEAGFTNKIENEHGCCGWYNVFDYCDASVVSEIMADVIRGDSLRDFMEPEADDYTGMVSSSSAMAGSDNPDYDYSSQNYGENNSSNDYGSDDYGDSYYTDAECEAFYKEGDERCVCSQTEGLGKGDVPYNDKVCYVDEFGQDVFVKNLCNGTTTGTDGKTHQICNLNGCGDIIMHIIKTEYLQPIATIAIVLAVFYLIGLVFTLQLTINYQQMKLGHKETYEMKKGSLRKRVSTRRRADN